MCRRSERRLSSRNLRLIVLMGRLWGAESACDTFATQPYCCDGANETSSTCTPTAYSQNFKKKCPKALTPILLTMRLVPSVVNHPNIKLSSVQETQLCTSS
ncbi:hypothetical protein OIU78_000099 [Salix suchowensis]|nr:hypothetical protein OIU78_000099 [Salix suchowensis]